MDKVEKYLKAQERYFDEVEIHEQELEELLEYCELEFTYRVVIYDFTHLFWNAEVENTVYYSNIYDRPYGYYRDTDRLGSQSYVKLSKKGRYTFVASENLTDDDRYVDYISIYIFDNSMERKEHNE